MVYYSVIYKTYSCMPGVALWLRHSAISSTVSGWIPGGDTGDFSVATDRTMCPGIDSASKNEYQGFLLG